MRAWSLIREQPHYRAQAFRCGLARAGYEVMTGPPPSAPRRDDVLVIWNRYAHYETHAEQFEAAGARVIVAENGYLGENGSTPKFDVAGGAVEQGHYYALALSRHNGGGRWPSDDGSRWRKLGIELKPWRAQKPGDREIGRAGDRTAGRSEERESGRAGDRESDNRHVLVCPQRGIAPDRERQHEGWPTDAADRIRRATKRPVRVRPHPGLGPGAVPIASDLENCWAVVIWASGAGIHALLAGVPVIAEGPYWILAQAASRYISAVDAPPLPERLPAFERLACAQWTVSEIESGVPFKLLLNGNLIGPARI